MRFLFTLRGRVGRREYALVGVSLALLKYLGDVALIWWGAHQMWTPLDYVTSAPFLLSRRLSLAPPWLLPGLGAWTLPFVWIGIAMSVRRAVDAGFSAWLALLFFVPFGNYALIVALCLAPSSEVPRAVTAMEPGPSRMREALLSLAAGGVVGIGMIALSVSLMTVYGTALFLGTPFVMGTLAGFLYNRRLLATGGQTFGLILLMFLAVGAIVLVSGWDGAI